MSVFPLEGCAERFVREDGRLGDDLLSLMPGHAGGDLRGLGLPSVADDTDTTSGR